MATWDDVGRIAEELPETDSGTSYGERAWKVKSKTFIWERPLRRSDLEALGDAAPTGPVVGASVADEGVKLALIDENPAVYFTTPHFDGYPAILFQLDRIEIGDLEELVVEAWLSKAPRRLAKAYVDGEHSR